MVTLIKDYNQFPNGGKEASPIGLMSLMSVLVANQNTVLEEGVDQKAAPRNTTPKQKGCSTLLIDTVKLLPL
ncbi:hypothetical protein DSO57_1016735 [Entomophthora muscae]|uniref:Uncharacterized protein n=1 Tax=Entomophthora muscae TaxID=34485 RepID=A0ACC2TRY9_9FUNG|nr:hypothetical protein DSO57_1016735 [Entomophthora muscae]